MGRGVLAHARLSVLQGPGSAVLLLSRSDSSRFGLEEAVPERRRLLRSEGSRDAMPLYLDIK